MYLSSAELPRVLPEHRQLLQNLVIDSYGPGTVLRDFETLLDTSRKRMD
jgi:hypothetical protein